MLLSVSIRNVAGSTEKCVRSGHQQTNASLALSNRGDDSRIAAAGDGDLLDVWHTNLRVR